MAARRNGARTRSTSTRGARPRPERAKAMFRAGAALSRSATTPTAGESRRYRGQYRQLEAAVGSRRGRGFEISEGLGGLAQGVGDGLVPVHVRTAGAQFPGALLAQGRRYGRTDQLIGHRHLEDVGFGGALNGRGGLGPGGGQRARDPMEIETHQAAVAARLEGADDPVAE